MWLPDVPDRQRTAEPKTVDTIPTWNKHRLDIASVSHIHYSFEMPTVVLYDMHISQPA